MAGGGPDRRLHGLVAVLVLSLVAACAGPAYYVQAVGGHLQLMHARRDVASLRASPETPPQLARRLELAQAILDFAETELDLPAGGNYRSYVETGREAVVWNVVAAPEFSLQPRRWCFLVAGCVPYRGYFSLEAARKSAARLRDKGYDVSVTPATAYSTLGWFRDPLLDTMLAQPDVYLAATLFHELAHLKIHVPGDTPFNESWATFVEREATLRWLRQAGDHGQAEVWLERLRAGDRFFGLLEATRDELERLYARSMGRDEMRDAKRAVLEQLQADYRRLVNDAWRGRSHFAYFFEPPPNNADLALIASYRGGICAFEGLLRRAGGDFRALHRLAGELAASGTAARSEFLRADCSGQRGEIARESQL